MTGGGSKCVVGIGGVLRGVGVGAEFVGAGHWRGGRGRSTHYESVCCLYYTSPPHEYTENLIGFDPYHLVIASKANGVCRTSDIRWEHKV